MSAAVDIKGIVKIKVYRVKDHPNSGVWLLLFNYNQEVAWVSVWIPAPQLADSLESLAGFLRGIDKNESLDFTIEEIPDATSVETKTPTV